MKSKTNLVLLVAVFAATLFLISSVSAAFADISNVEVNGIDDAQTGGQIGVFAGETVPVRVFFTANSDAQDVRIKAWLSGESGNSVSTERFDVIAGNTYSRLVSVQMPSRIDPDEDFKLEVSIESENDGIADQEKVNLVVQREAYNVEVLDATLDSKVTAGNTLPVDIVLKNRGRHLAEDTFVTVSIPALGIQQKAYFGDLSPVDQANPDKEDAVERRMLVNVPSDAPAGIYVVEIAAYNDDSTATVNRKVLIAGASEDTMAVSSVNSRTFSVGEKGEYSLTLVNSGNKVLIYDLVFETPSGLTVDTEDQVVVVPAGSSKTVKLETSAMKAGKYTFSVDVMSNGNLVKRESYSANVESKGLANGAVLLTVILAIIFVVLLVVLIVLLTRKPETKEEFGESYY